jgi:hypothetical protein
MNADKINQRSRFGHLLEFDKEAIVLGIDLIVSPNSCLGTTLLTSDVNGNGVVDVNDILLVIAALEDLASALVAHSQPFAAYLDRWIDEAKQYNPGDKTSQKGIVVLAQPLAALRPTETVLLANYPNPFNPETWIPYHLAYAADVTLTIYDIKGAVVRQLDMGHQSVGYYTDRSQAAYWDGHNERGESVASGVYFYQFRVGCSALSAPHRKDYTATRQRVILK